MPLPRLDHPLGLLENRLVLHDAHRPELLRPVVLVQHLVGVLPELLHVRADKHLAELDKVAVGLVVHLDGAPGVGATADLPAVLRVDE